MQQLRHAQARRDVHPLFLKNFFSAVKTDGGAMPKRRDWAGQRFGRLVAVSFVGRKHHNAVWLIEAAAELKALQRHALEVVDPETSG